MAAGKEKQVQKMGRIIIFPKSYIREEDKCSKVELPNRCPNCGWLNLKRTIVPDNCKWCSGADSKGELIMNRFDQESEVFR